MNAPSPPITIKVLSYNIHKGFAAGSFKFTLAKIKEAILNLGVDIVFLQEVQGEHAAKSKKYSDWPNESQFEYLADQTWSHYAYGKNAVYFDGHHGNAILSKYPIIEWENIDVSTNAIEKRGLLYAKLLIPDINQSMHCVCLHLNLFRKGRTAQLEKLCEMIRKKVPAHEKLIVAGDFNDWSKKAGAILNHELSLTEVFKILHGKYAKTYPSSAPLLSLDRIYFRFFAPLEAKRIQRRAWGNLSDHLPIYAALSLE